MPPFLPFVIGAAETALNVAGLVARVAQVVLIGSHGLHFALSDRA